MLNGWLARRIFLARAFVKDLPVCSIRARIAYVTWFKLQMPAIVFLLFVVRRFYISAC